MDIIHFSSRGPMEDGRLGPTLFAVGTHVQGPATLLPGFIGDAVCDKFWPMGQTFYSRSSGTSHSTPVVAGAAMIAHEFLLSRGLLELAPSAAMIKAILTNTARDMAGGSDNNQSVIQPVPSVVQGWGSVNLSNLADAEGALTLYDQELIFNESGQQWSTPIQAVEVGKPLKITLCWSDAPGNPAAAIALVNDLDLEVIGDDGTYYGNVFSGGMSQTGSLRDRLNNLESVFIENPSGNYRVRVMAHNIAGDGLPNNEFALDQDFALFVWNGTDQTPAGIISLNKARVSCGNDALRVTVSDEDLQGVGTIVVELESAAETEQLTLVEEQVNSGIFKRNYCNQFFADEY